MDSHIKRVGSKGTIWPDGMFVDPDVRDTHEGLGNKWHTDRLWYRATGPYADIRVASCSWFTQPVDGGLYKKTCIFFSFGFQHASCSSGFGLALDGLGGRRMFYPFKAGRFLYIIYRTICIQNTLHFGHTTYVCFSYDSQNHIVMCMGDYRWGFDW
jgi:hypothetical protein